jgi:hypothetical protein
MQTLSGRKFSLTGPDPAAVDFAADVAPALAKIARFCGHTRGLYSVAQHCVVGADAMYAEHGGHAHLELTTPSRLAALFLLHDAHEAYMGDITTPVVAALDHIRCPYSPHGFFKQVVNDLKHRLDAAIHQAAGVDLPTADESRIIRDWDTRMMIAERNALMGKPPEDWGASVEVEPSPVDKSALWPWEEEGSVCAWLDAFNEYVGRAR